MIFDNRLIFPPINHPRRILDCGCGGGNWAVEVAERYPSTQVIGVDISPHLQPLDLPDNLWLQIDDLNRSFTFPSRHFDLVHSRLVASGINRSRWTSYIRDLVRVTKRGGWVQMIELNYNTQSDNGSLTDQHALREWSRRYIRSLEDLKDLRIGSRLGSLMTAAGLVEVDTTMIQLPLSAWARDSRTRQIGASNRPNVHQLLESVALYPFTQRLHMPEEDFWDLISRARAEADDLSLKAYFPL
ncbi:S-adenosyl-L-methionine-dependent methyltransferase [Talaromyces proteolyticus]|uniref:S-adenosyl-L-methionine-dependent methyltransferase n=1 Tax=Talaromyces proteolyticus TaxID=1131652 RepID=A0AAD4PW15_9EURO|nr:S-adenosyl-L-methionine-dependent methyltransferase [Talaromyces proteolyticus]KAH8691402.1 S-adenosyl-L-methionine-dependent methyltransferase [Talaromyces proteolyticus]